MRLRRILIKVVLAFGAALAGAAGALTYESPAAGIARAEKAGAPAPGAAAVSWADAGWRALFVENDYTRARACFEAALAKDAGSARALEGYGRTLEITGDYEGALRAYLAFVAAAPDHPAAYVYLNRCHVLEEDTNARAYFISALEALAARTDTPPPLKATATLYLFDRAHRGGDFEKAEKLLATLAPIREWRFIGPFENKGKQGFDEVYPPEREFDPDAAYPGKARTVRWRPTPARLPTGFLDLTTVLTPAENGTAYLAVAVVSPVARGAALAMGAGGAVKVWLNGDLIFSRDAYHDGYFDQYVAAAPLAAGSNLLLVKICGDDSRWGFGARFVDAAGAPLTDLGFSVDAGALATAARVQSRPSGGSEGLGFFDGRIAGGNGDAFDYYYAALAHAARADTDEREEIPAKYLLAAAGYLPGAAELYYQLGLGETEESRRRNHLAQALELASEHNQARLEVAKYYYELGRPREALAALDEVSRANAAFTEAAQYRAKIYWEEGWAYDARDRAAEINPRLPAYPYSKMVAAQFEENYGDIGRAVALWREIFDADIYATVARDNLFTLLLDRDQPDDALAVMTRALAADPYDPAAREKTVAACAAFGRFGDALAAADAALTFRPEDYGILTRKGWTLEQLGRTAEARATFRAAIAAKQNYPAMENYLNYVEPGRGATEASRRLDAYDLLASYPGDEVYPRDSAVWLLNDNAVEVFDNGTTSRTVHEVVRILTPEGADKFRQMYISYTPDMEMVELKRAAVLKPDGTETAASQVEEYNVYDVWSRLYYSYVNKVVTMPSLGPGDTVDFEYRVSQTGANIFADYFGDYFYFGDKNSTRRARYALTVPAGTTYHFRTLRGVPAPTKTEDKGKTTYVYEMSDLPAVEEEPYMPALAEIMPCVEVSTFGSWDDVGGWYNGLIKDVFRPSPEVEAVAARLAAESPDDLTTLRRAYDFTVSQIRYVGLEFGIGGYKPHTPKQCLEALYGDCKDKATLMNTLFRLYGFQAYPALVRTADLGELDYELPILGLFNHMISHVVLPDGRSFFLDGTAEYYGYDELPAGDQGINVLVVADDHAAFQLTPVLTADANLLSNRTTFVLMPDGDAQVHRAVNYGAADSPAQRERFHVAAKRKAVIEEFWNGLYPGTRIYNEQFSDIADLGRPVRIEYDAVVPSAFDAQAERVSFDGVIQKSGLIDIYGKKAKRRWPLIIRTNKKTVSELTYILPPGYKVASAPLTKEFRSPFGTFTMNVQTTEGRVSVTQELILYAQRVAAEDYEAFRSFCVNVDEWESEPIILIKER